MSKYIRILQALILLSSMLFATTGQCNSVTDFFKNVLGSNADRVAVKVADLPQKYHDVFSWGMAFSPNGKYLAVESEYENVKIWDWRKGHIVAALEIPHGAAGADNNPIQYSPDGMLLADCVGRGKGDVFVRIWNTSDWSIAKDIVGHGDGGCSAVSFTPNGKLFVRTVGGRVGFGGDTIIVDDASTWQPLWSLQLNHFDPEALAVSPSGESVAIAGVLYVVPPDAHLSNVNVIKHEPTIYIINLQHRKIVKTIKSETKGSLAWSPDGARIAIERSFVEIFDAGSGKKLVQEKIADAGSRDIQYTSDGRYFIESDLNGMGKGLGVKIWDSQRKKLLQEIPVGDVGSIAVSRNGKYLAVGATGHTTIWQFK